ncbi:MAG TPA: serine/threonine protein kinase [Oscillatoriaceae cyanobacterium M33_DOE_052]|uniref:Serine/threonine protein kinase n=1 Tax=Planktothricoides sp. SpSt-374 TaxID=2282167 RepID=A0A7C3VJ31_9CYAN|nr:serine/threonine protein kinase [Oscillatoriaceae cyanobacterium M33_DOE_052]
MSYCINPKCPDPDDQANENKQKCVHCGCELLLHNRYRIVRFMGGGGFGKTYEVVDERGAPKVLKILLQNQEKAIELFKQEADVLSRLNHGGIPKVEPEGYFIITPPDATEPLYCLVMEKINGLNLREWMKKRGNRPISQEQAVDWLKQMAEILYQVHAQNFFHRDIKPLNIMIKPNGQLVLIDFGAAREVTNTYFAKIGQGQNITGIVSPGYTAPEQANGKAVPQSDFYSLGRTWVFLLTGKSPTAFSEHPRTGKLVWRNSAPQISKSFADVIDYMMAPFPGKRPQNTQSIVQCLAEIDTAPPGDAEESQPPKGSNSRIRSQGGSTGQLRRTNSSLPASSISSRSSSGKKGTIVKPKPQKKKIPWRLGLSLVVGLICWTQIYGYWRYGLFPASPMELIASFPSSKFLLKSIRGVGQVQALAVGAMGANQIVAGGSYGSIRVWNIASGEKLLSIDAHKDWVNSLAIAPDGGILASGGADKIIRLWNLSNGTRRVTIPAHSAAVRVVAVDPYGQIVASGSEDKTIKLWDLYSGSWLLTIPAHDAAVNTLAFSPDGRTIVSGGADKMVKIWDVRTGARMRTLRGHANAVLAVAFSPDGQTLATASADNTIRVWDMKTGQTKYELRGDSSWVRSLAISPDGQVLASSGGLIEIWDLRNGELATTLVGHSKYVAAIAISPDGKHLISGSPDQTIKIWNLPTIGEMGKGTKNN